VMALTWGANSVRAGYHRRAQGGGGGIRRQEARVPGNAFIV